MAAKHYKKFTMYIAHSPVPVSWADIQRFAEATAKELGARGAVIHTATGLWDGKAEGVSTVTIIAEASDRNILLVDALMESFGRVLKQDQILYTMEDIEACFVDILPHTPSF